MGGDWTCRVFRSHMVMLTCLYAERTMASALIGAGIFMTKPHSHYYFHGAEMKFLVHCHPLQLLGLPAKSPRKGTEYL